MKNKKGFTLIEIIAVIALISVLVLLVVPNVMGTFFNGKKNAFKDEALILYKNATTTYITRSELGDTSKRFCAGINNDNNTLDINNKSKLYYDILVDEYGTVIDMKISNETYGMSLSNTNGIKKKDITIEKITDKIEINCN